MRNRLWRFIVVFPKKLAKKKSVLLDSCRKQDFETMPATIDLRLKQFRSNLFCPEMTE